MAACLPGYLIAAASASTPPKHQSQAPSLRDLEIQTILDTLKQYNGNKTKAANALGIDRSTLWRKLKRDGVT